MCRTEDRLLMKDIRRSDVVSGQHEASEFLLAAGVHQLIEELRGNE
jgi:hypothetical protein